MSTTAFPLINNAKKCYFISHSYRNFINTTDQSNYKSKKKYQQAETSNRYKNCIKWQGIPHQHMMCQAHSLNPLLPSATNMRRSAKILILI